MRLSVFETLTGTLRLAVRYFWFLLIASIIAAAPDNFPTIHSNQANTPTISEICVSVAAVALSFIFSAMKAAAILGVLKGFSPGSALWPTVTASIHRHSTPLIKLTLLLLVIAIAIYLPIVAIAWVLMPVGLEIADWVLVAGSIIYLIFLKYALAFPLVVVEEISPLVAVKRSWNLTRGRFFYVLGCYVVLAGLEVLVNLGLAHYLPVRHGGLSALGMNILKNMIDSSWLILGLCMYLRIIKAESYEPPPPPVDLLAPIIPR